MKTPGWMVAPGLLLMACGTTTESKPVAEFPSAATLSAIQARPMAAPKIEAPDTPTEGWAVEVEGERPSAQEPWQPKGDWETSFATAARTGSKARLTRGMSCLAREIGRYYLAHQVLAPAALRAFMAGACGALSAQIGAQILPGQVPDGVPAPAVAALRAQMTAELMRHLPAAATEVGFAFVRERDKVVGTTVFGRLPAEVAPFALVPDAADEIKIEGTILDQAEYIAAYANKGRFEVQSCYVNPTVARPRFRVSCLVDPEDESAWIEVVYARPKRVVAHAFLQVLARRHPERPLRYTGSLFPAGAAAATADEFAGRVVTALNETRTQAGLPVVRLSAAQSATAAGLAGHYFAASDEGGGEQGDTIALGLLAGWQVGGMIRDGSFFAGLVPHTRDPARWLSTTLAMPMGRVALLDPTIEEIALGPVLLSSPDAVGAVVTGYRLHHGNDHTTDIKRLLMRTAAARRRMKLEAPGRLAGMDVVMREELARVHEGKAQPMEALEAVMEHGVQHFGAGMRGYVVEATSLEALEIPEGVLKQPTLHLEIGVTHHKAPGAAWAQLVILVVFVDYGDKGA